MKQDPNALNGQVFNEMYKIIRPIGAGGMGAIYEAVHTRLANKKYAVKMLHAAIAQDPEVFQRFRREAEIASELGHDHIVTVHDFNVTHDGAPYMVMELLNGEDLSQRIAKNGSIPIGESKAIIDQVCSALDAAHKAGIVHRDLKPQNIFLCRMHGKDDFVKVLDFGVSKVKDSSSVVTRDHTLMGTPFYMSPEQADGMVHQIDSRTDIFALGAIIWEMFTGRMAFEAPTVSGAMYKVVHVDPPEIHTLRPDVPAAVSMVLRRALAKDKNNRYATVLELATDFGNALQGTAPSVAPPPSTAIPATMLPSPMMTSHGRPATPPPMQMGQPMPRPGSEAALAQTGYATPPPSQALGVQPLPVNYMSSPGVPMQPMQQPMGAGSQPMTPMALAGQPPTSTFSSASGQMMAVPAHMMQPTGTMGPGGQTFQPAKKGNGLVIGIVGVLLVAGAGAGGYVALSKKNKEVAVAPQPTPSPAPAPAPAPVPAPVPKPDPVKVDPVKPAPEPVKPAPDPEVTLTLELPAGVKPSKLTVDGKPVVGNSVTMKKGTAMVAVHVEAPGFHGFDVKVAPDADKKVPITLRRVQVQQGTTSGDKGDRPAWLQEKDNK